MTETRVLTIMKKKTKNKAPGIKDYKIMQLQLAIWVNYMKL